MSSEHLPPFFEVHHNSYLELSLSLSEVPAKDFHKYNRNELFYYLFENVFYNSKIVKNKQKYYLKFINQQLSITYPFLDIGCGRGEFIELLVENHVNCFGIDINQLEISLLDNKKLPVKCSDALSYLNKGDEEKYLGISAIQVIEHLDTNYLNKLLSQAFKTIIPGGVIILETVNPHCLYALSNFYQDSTHIKPLPPEMMKFLLEWHGFEKVSIVYSSPIPKTSGRSPDVRMNYQDYALIGYKSIVRKNKLISMESEQEEDSSLVSKRQEQLLKVVIDGVFFQLYKTGIARVWKSLLEQWVNSSFAKHIVVVDRAGTTPAIPGIRYRTVPAYDYNNTDADREMLQQVCDEEGADLFISSYYTTPLSTPSIFMAYDMIPELMGWDLNHPMWREKHYGIQNAAAYIAISENTARDLVKVFPEIALESVTVAKSGIERKVFSPANSEIINQFKTKYGISKPYFILVGAGGNYKNSILFFKAFAQLYSSQGFDIICTGSGFTLEADYRAYTSGSTVHLLQLSDEELSIAYSGAVALVYPSKYEGFGLPVLEAIACGCPVITCPNASIPEVAGEAALYVKDEDVDGLTNALCDVQKPNIRNSLIAAGLEQAKKFSWSKMAETVSSALIDATLQPLNLSDINLIIFPDWSQPEETLCLELEQVIKAIAIHPDSSKTTLLIDNGNIPEEEAALIISSVSMNLLMQEELDVSEGLEISFLGQLGEIQWKALLPQIQARIVLENENQEAIALFKAENIPSLQIKEILLA